MTFSKSFPKTIKGSTYPLWEEVSLSEEEEKNAELMAKRENIQLLKDCIDEARSILKENGLKEYQSDIVALANSLFEKVASHNVYHKENMAREKFQKQV